MDGPPGSALREQTNEGAQQQRTARRSLRGSRRDPVRRIDTSPAATAVQLGCYQRMTPAARLRVALELTETGRGLMQQGIRKRHPEYSEDEVRLAFIRLWLGPELFRRAYPTERELAP